MIGFFNTFLNLAPQIMPLPVSLKWEGAIVIDPITSHTPYRLIYTSDKSIKLLGVEFKDYYHFIIKETLGPPLINIQLYPSPTPLDCTSSMWAATDFFKSISQSLPGRYERIFW